DGTVKLRDATTGAALATLLTSSSAATCAAFRGDGSLIAAGFEDGTVRLCDPATNQPVGPPRSMRHAVRDVAFLPDGRSVAALAARRRPGRVRRRPRGPRPRAARGFEPGRPDAPDRGPDRPADGDRPVDLAARRRGLARAARAARPA